MSGATPAPHVARMSWPLAAQSAPVISRVSSIRLAAQQAGGAHGRGAPEMTARARARKAGTPRPATFERGADWKAAWDRSVNLALACTRSATVTMRAPMRSGKFEAVPTYLADAKLRVAPETEARVTMTVEQEGGLGGDLYLQPFRAEFVNANNTDEARAVVIRNPGSAICPYPRFITWILDRICSLHLTGMGIDKDGYVRSYGFVRFFGCIDINVSWTHKIEHFHQINRCINPIGGGGWLDKQFFMRDPNHPGRMDVQKALARAIDIMPDVSFCITADVDDPHPDALSADLQPGAARVIAQWSRGEKPSHRILWFGDLRMENLKPPTGVSAPEVGRPLAIGVDVLGTNLWATRTADDVTEQLGHAHGNFAFYPTAAGPTLTNTDMVVMTPGLGQRVSGHGAIDWAQPHLSEGDCDIRFDACKSVLKSYEARLERVATKVRKVLGERRDQPKSVAAVLKQARRLAAKQDVHEMGVRVEARLKPGTYTNVPSYYQDGHLKVEPGTYMRTEVYVTPEMGKGEPKPGAPLRVQPHSVVFSKPLKIMNPMASLPQTGAVERGVKWLSKSIPSLGLVEKVDSWVTVEIERVDVLSNGDIVPVGTVRKPTLMGGDEPLASKYDPKTMPALQMDVFKALVGLDPVRRQPTAHNRRMDPLEVEAFAKKIMPKMRYMIWANDGTTRHAATEARARYAQRSRRHPFTKGFDWTLPVSGFATSGEVALNGDDSEAPRFDATTPDLFNTSALPLRRMAISGGKAVGHIRRPMGAQGRRQTWQQTLGYAARVHDWKDRTRGRVTCRVPFMDPTAPALLPPAARLVAAG